MKVAVTYENGQVFQHFGHSKQFKVYEIQGQQAGPGEILDAGGSGHSALAQLLQQAGVDALICGGIGGGAREALRQAGIQLYAGVAGPADDAAQALAQGTLQSVDDATCDHHGEEHHHCGHHGDHHCGGHCGK